MALPIQPIRPPASVAPLSPAAPSRTTGAGGFGSFLSDAIARVDQVQQGSQNAVQKFLSGEDEEVHKVALAAQEAELNFDLCMQIRNKVVSAYQEVMRMQM